MKLKTYLSLIVLTLLSHALSGKVDKPSVGASFGLMEFENSGIQFDGDYAFDFNFIAPFYKRGNFGADFSLDILVASSSASVSGVNFDLETKRSEVLFRPYYNFDAIKVFGLGGVGFLSTSLNTASTSSEVLSENDFLYGVGFEVSNNAFYFTPNLKFSNYGIPGEGFIYELPLSYNLNDSIDLTFTYEASDFDSYTNTLGLSDKVSYSLFTLGFSFLL